MDLHADLKWIHQALDNVNDPSFITKLKHLLQNLNKEDNDLEYNADIDSALENVSKGNSYSTEQARDIAKKWGRK